MNHNASRMRFLILSKTCGNINVGQFKRKALCSTSHKAFLLKGQFNFLNIVSKEPGERILFILN